ncbi:MAG: hypothetical protein LBD37_03055 [Treponema sp.]|jgi:hypothetical protein|nr:hypothetical protein [Treponema sp.]
MHSNDEKQNPSLAVIAFIFGVLGASGILADEWGLLISLGFSITAIVLGVRARKDALLSNQKTELATGAFVLGIVFTVWNAIKIVFWILVLFTFLSLLRSCSGGY